MNNEMKHETDLDETAEIDAAELEAILEALRARAGLQDWRPVRRSAGSFPALNR